MLTISRIEALELKVVIERRSRGFLRHDAEKDRAFCSMIAKRERKTRSDLSSIRVAIEIRLRGWRRYRDSLARKKVFSEIVISPNSLFFIRARTFCTTILYSPLSNLNFLPEITRALLFFYYQTIFTSLAARTSLVNICNDKKQ